LYPRVKHQLGTFRKSTDLGAHLVNKRHRHRIIADALHVFGASPATEARQRLPGFGDTWAQKEPKVVRAFCKGFENCLVYLEYPETVRTMLKTTNPIECSLEETRRRIIPMKAFNNT
jgi:putative transposase